MKSCCVAKFEEVFLIHFIFHIHFFSPEGSGDTAA